MPLADWIRASLWREADWPAALHELCERVTASAPSAARIAELAAASELVDPARERALALHRFAWQHGGDRSRLLRAIELARELGDHVALAALAVAAHEQTREIEHLMMGAHAFLDGDYLDEAEPLLARAVQIAPQAEEPRSLFTMLKGQSRDAQVDVATWVARATRASGAEAGRLFMHAARLARLAGLDAIYQRHLQAAYQRGQHPDALMLIEAGLVAERRANDLIAFYRSRIEAAGSDHRFADIMRAAGMSLYRHSVQRGLAVRMLRNSLEAAYRARQVDIAAHLACWDLLIRHSRDTRSTRELMPLVVEAMALPLDDDARLYLARFGHDVAMHDANDPQAARPYAELVSELQAIGAKAVPLEPLTPAPPVMPVEVTVTVKLKPGLPKLPRAPTMEPRIAPRVVLPADVQLFLGKEWVSAIVRDLSATGMYVVLERELTVGSTLQLVVELPVAPGALEVVVHQLTARVVRKAFHGYGLELVAPPDAFIANLATLQQ